MNEQNLEVALVGCGRISKRHVEAIGANRGIRIAMVCDIVEQKARALAEELGVPWVTRLTDIRDVDIIAIATPSGLHPRHTITAFEKTNARFVVCEKPLSLTVREIIEMYRAARETRKTFLPVYQNRYNPLIVFMKDLIKEDRLGRIFQVTINIFWNRNDTYYQDGWHGTMELDGGVLYTQASHYVDMLLHLLGRVRDAKGLKGRLRGLETPDTISAVFEFERGTVGSLNATVSCYRKNYLTEATFIGERGTIRLSGTNLNTITYWDVEGVEKPDIDFTLDHIYGKGHDSMYRYIVERRFDMFPSYEEVKDGIVLMEKISF